MGTIVTHAKKGAPIPSSHEVRGSNPLRSIHLQVNPSARATLGQRPVLMLDDLGIQLPGCSARNRTFNRLIKSSPVFPTH